MRPSPGATFGHAETGEAGLDRAVVGSEEVEDIVEGGSLLWPDEVHGVSSRATEYGTLFEEGPTVDESGAAEHCAGSMSGGLDGESGPLLV